MLSGGKGGGGLLVLGTGHLLWGLMFFWAVILLFQAILIKKDILAPALTVSIRRKMWSSQQWLLFSSPEAALEASPNSLMPVGCQLQSLVTEDWDLNSFFFASTLKKSCFLFASWYRALKTGKKSGHNIGGHERFLSPLFFPCSSCRLVLRKPFEACQDLSCS